MTAPVTTPTPTRFIGCDVGKAAIVVCDSRDGGTRTLANTPEALAAFATGLDATGLDATCLVVCETIDGYEDALLTALLAARVPAHRAGLVLPHPDPHEIAREVVAPGQTMQRLTGQILLRHLTLERDAVGTVSSRVWRDRDRGRELLPSAPPRDVAS